MKALISPNEILVDKFGEQGMRVAEIEPDNEIFEVAEPLFWVDCSEYCEADKFFYKNGEICIFEPIGESINQDFFDEIDEFDEIYESGDEEDEE